MKKTLMVIMMALLAVSVAFAVTTNPTNGQISANPGEKSLTANLTLTHDNFAGYSFGFSSTSPTEGEQTTNAVDTVTDATSVIIDYISGGDANNSKHDIYYYYKVRSSQTVTLKMTADQLTETTNQAKLNYSVTGTGLKAASVDVKAPGTVLLEKIITNKYEFGSSKLTFDVAGLTAANIGTYEAAITFAISAE